MKLTKSLITHLSQFATENKKQLMQQVLANRTKYLTVVLENIFQPHNASAVMRSCDCFGIQDLHVIEQSNQFKPSKGVALGSAKWIDVHKHTQAVDCIQQLKQSGYQIVATSLRPGSIPLEQLDLTQKTALCFGTEETGLTEELHQLADQQIYIPMYGFTQSFNISVSAALCLYELTKKLHHSMIPWQLTAEEKEELTLAWLIKTVPQGKALVKDFLAKNLP